MTDRNKKELCPESESLNTCAVIQDLLPGYVDQILLEPSTALVEKHLKECDACQAVCQKMKTEAPVVEPLDVPMESALGRTGRKMKKQRWTVWILCILLMISAGLLLSAGYQAAKIPSQSISVRPAGSSEGKSLFRVTAGDSSGIVCDRVRSEPDGRYDITLLGGGGILKGSLTRDLALEDPVRQIFVNGSLAYEEGVPIEPRCRDLFAYTDGYAGDVSRIQSVLGLSHADEAVQIRLDTEDPANSKWTISSPLPKTAGERELQIYKNNAEMNAMLAMALTPNLSEVRYQWGKDQSLSVSRDDYRAVLSANQLDEKIEDHADLQKIMNAVLGPSLEPFTE